jgi:hypothetical protein
MTIVEGFDKLMSLDVRGKFGYSSGFGNINYGYSKFGFLSSVSGIYQRKKTLKGYKTSLMKFYGPTNPRTITQQSWRTVFSNAMSAYQGLTSQEKVLLSKEARKYRMTGHNLFIRRYLQANRA